jgi:hypothetical protein
VFLHRLALALHKTVGELEAAMSVRELHDWMRFEGWYQPLPDRLSDLHVGLPCTLLLLSQDIGLWGLHRVA